MEFRTKREARLRIARLLGDALKADVQAVEYADPSAAKKGEQLRAEAARIRALLPGLEE